MISQSKITVRYAETDKMGIVHHSNYPVWFEIARTDFIKALGVPYSVLEEKGLMLPLIGLSCRYINLVILPYVKLYGTFSALSASTTETAQEEKFNCLKSCCPSQNWLSRSVCWWFRISAWYPRRCATAGNTAELTISAQVFTRR